MDDVNDDEQEEKPRRLVNYRQARAEREAAASAAAAASPAPSPPVVIEHEPEPVQVSANTNASPTPKRSSASKERTGVGQTAGSGVASTPPKADDAPWSSRDADLVWDEMNGGDHPRSLAKYGKSAYDAVIVVARSEGGRRVVLDTINGQDVLGGNGVTPGEALRLRVEQSHLTVAQGPVQYDVQINLKPSTMHARTVLGMPSPAEIVALRRTRSQQPGFAPGAAGYPPPPPPQFQQPYAQPVYAQQPPPSPPQQQPAPGYGAPPVQPPYPHQQQQTAHDPEVSHLRTEVAGLSGAVREMMEFMRGERRTPPSPPPQQPVAPPPGPTQGFGGSPGAPWPRRPVSEADELREELADLRSEVSVLYRQRSAPQGFGAPPAPQHAPPAPQASPQPPPRVPEGPNGEIWVERVGWCVPKDRVQPAVAAPLPTPVAVAPAPAVAAATPVGVGALPADPIQQLVTSARSYARGGKALYEAMEELSTTFSGLGNPAGGTETPTEPEPPVDTGPELPFEVVSVEGAELFGHPVKYTPNRRTGKLDLEGFAMSNPGVLEEGVKLVGVAFEALSSFARRAATSTAGTTVAGLPPAGVGGTPQAQQAQVVDSIPEGAQDASSAYHRANGAGSFPAV